MPPKPTRTPERIEIGGVLYLKQLDNGNYTLHWADGERFNGAHVLSPQEAAALQSPAGEWRPIAECLKEPRKLYLVTGPWAGEINGIDSGDVGPFVAEYERGGDYEGFDWRVWGTDAYAAWCKPTLFAELPPLPPAPTGEVE